MEAGIFDYIREEEKRKRDAERAAKTLVDPYADYREEMRQKKLAAERAGTFYEKVREIKGSPLTGKDWNAVSGFMQGRGDPGTLVDYLSAAGEEERWRPAVAAQKLVHPPGLERRQVPTVPEQMRFEAEPEVMERLRSRFPNVAEERLAAIANPGIGAAVANPLETFSALSGSFIPEPLGEQIERVPVAGKPLRHGLDALFNPLALATLPFLGGKVGVEAAEALVARLLSRTGIRITVEEATTLLATKQGMATAARMLGGQVAAGTAGELAGASPEQQALLEVGGAVGGPTALTKEGREMVRRMGGAAFDKAISPLTAPGRRLFAVDFGLDRPMMEAGAGFKEPPNRGMKFIPFDKLDYRPDLFQARETDPGKAFSQANVDALIAKPWDEAQLQPGAVVANPDKPGRYIVLEGHTRSTAAEQLYKAGIRTTETTDAPHGVFMRVLEGDINKAADRSRLVTDAVMSNYGTMGKTVAEDYRAFNKAVENGARIGDPMTGPEDIDTLARRSGLKTKYVQSVLDMGRLDPSTVPGGVMERVVTEPALAGIAAELGRGMRVYGISKDDAVGWFDRIARSANRPTTGGLADTIDKFGRQLADAPQGTFMGMAAEDVGGAKAGVLKLIDDYAVEASVLRTQKNNLKKLVAGAGKTQELTGLSTEEHIAALRKLVAKVEEDIAAHEQGLNRALREATEAPAPVMPEQYELGGGGAAQPTFAREGEGAVEQPQGTLFGEVGERGVESTPMFGARTGVTPDTPAGTPVRMPDGREGILNQNPALKEAWVRVKSHGPKAKWQVVSVPNDQLTIIGREAPADLLLLQTPGEALTAKTAPAFADALEGQVRADLAAGKSISAETEKTLRETYNVMQSNPPNLRDFYPKYDEFEAAMKAHNERLTRLLKLREEVTAIKLGQVRPGEAPRVAEPAPREEPYNFEEANIMAEEQAGDAMEANFARLEAERAAAAPAQRLPTKEPPEDLLGQLQAHYEVAIDAKTRTSLDKEWLYANGLDPKTAPQDQVDELLAQLHGAPAAVAPAAAPPAAPVVSQPAAAGAPPTPEELMAKVRRAEPLTGEETALLKTEPYRDVKTLADEVYLGGGEAERQAAMQAATRGPAAGITPEAQAELDKLAAGAPPTEDVGARIDEQLAYNRLVVGAEQARADAELTSRLLGHKLPEGPMPPELAAAAGQQPPKPPPPAGTSPMRGGTPPPKTGAPAPHVSPPGQPLVGDLRPLPDVTDEVVTPSNIIVRILVGKTGLNPSVFTDTKVGKLAVAYMRQRVSIDLLTDVALQVAVDAHAQRFTGLHLNFDRDSAGNVRNVVVNKGQSRAWWDIYSRPDDYVLTMAQRAEINDYLRLAREMEELRVSYGLKPRSMDKDGWFYVPRQVEGIGGIELRRPSDPGLQRAYEEAQEGIAKGVKYVVDPRATMELHLRNAYNEILEAQMAASLDPLSITAKELIPAGVRATAMKAGQRMQQGKDAILKIQRAMRGERLPVGTIKSVYDIYPDLDPGLAELSRFTIDDLIEAGERARTEGRIVLKPVNPGRLDQLRQQVESLKAELQVNPNGKLQERFSKLNAKYGYAKFRFREEQALRDSEGWQFKDHLAHEEAWTELEISPTTLLLGGRKRGLELLLKQIRGDPYVWTTETGAKVTRYKGGMMERLMQNAARERTTQARALESARKAQVGPGHLFGRTEETIAIKQWNSRFLPREDAEALEEMVGRYFGVDKETNPFARGLELAGNYSRFLAAVGDFAAPLIHGLPTLAYRPDVWGKMTVGHYQAFFDPTVQARFIKDHIGTFQKMAQYGTPIGDPEFFAALTRQGGVSPGQLLELLPKGSEARRILQLAGKQTFGRFQSSYNTMLAMDRALLYEAKSAGWKGTESELWSFIRNLTGGLDSRALGVGPSQRGIESMWLAFSPRLLRSTAALMWKATQLQTVEGRESFRALAQLAAGGMGAYVLTGLALGKDWDEISVGMNPLNGKKFLSHNINGDWIGIGGQVRGITQLLAGIAATAATGDFDKFASWSQFDNPLLGFWTSRGAPAWNIAGGVVEMATGLNTLPFDNIDSLPDVARHIGTSSLPFAIQGVLEGQAWGTTGSGMVGFRTSAGTLSEKLNAIVPGWKEMSTPERDQVAQRLPEVRAMWDKQFKEALASGQEWAVQTQEYRTWRDQWETRISDAIDANQSGYQLAALFDSAGQDLAGKAEVIYEDRQYAPKGKMAQALQAWDSVPLEYPEGVPDWDSYFATKEAIAKIYPGVKEAVRDRVPSRWVDSTVREWALRYYDAQQLQEQYYNIPSKNTLAMDAATQEKVRPIVQAAEAQAPLLGIKAAAVINRSNIPDSLKYAALRYMRLDSNPERKKFKAAHPELQLWFREGVPITMAAAGAEGGY